MSPRPWFVRVGSALLVLAAGGCSHRAEGTQRDDATARPPEQEPPIRVTAVPVIERPMPDTFVLTGALRGDVQSSVAAGSTGVVEEAKIERGALVKKGDVLLRVKADQAAAGAAEAKANLESVRAQASLAEAECERSQRLFDMGAIAKAELDRQLTVCAAQREAAKAAEERAKAAQVLLGETTVRAPMDGMIAERFVSVGEYVRPDSKVVDLVAIDPLRLEISVPEALVARVREGLPVQFRVATFPDRMFEGRVRFVSPRLEAASRSMTVEAIVANPERELRPGMFATAEIALGERPKPVVPKSAIRVEGEASRVFAIVDGRAEERVVQPGGEVGDVVAIERGVAAGERVIAPVPPQLRDGARVE